MSNAELARHLELYADLLEVEGENRFKIRAYRNAARTIFDLPEQVDDMVEAEADLTTLPGVGKEIAEKLEAMVKTGELPQLTELAQKIPVGVAEVMRVKGMGPKLAEAAWRELGVDSVDELEAAAKAGKLGALAGFGEKRQASILKSIEAYRRNTERARIGEIDPVIAPLVAALRAVPGAERVEVAGSYRRRRETVGDIDLLAIAEGDAAAAITEAFVNHPEVDEVTGSGDTRSSVRLRNGLEVDLRVMGPESFGAALLYFTGSKAHNVALRQIALERGWHLTEYGLFEGTGEKGASPLSSGKVLASRTEEEIYEKLGLQYVEPEMREDRGELDLAAAFDLPDLITLEDLRGDLHMHSTWSDGKASVAEMMQACQERGYEYMALTDHSKALAMTGGLDEEKLARQWEELDRVVEENPGITLLRGMEVDILKDGSLDLSDEWLERLDVVIVSVHSHFALGEKEQTERIVKAVSHPQVNILGHPTGRIIGVRDGYQVDLPEVFEACLANGVAVELNASYQRLDLSDVNVIAARKRGLMVSIGTDAHSTKELDGMQVGIDQARRAWLTAGNVLNAQPLAEVRRFLAKGR